MAVVPPHGLSLPQLLAALAHDLKNPLAALTTNLHFLTDASGGATAERDEALDDSLVVAEQLDLLLRNLELFARGDAPSSRTAQVALSSILDDALGRVERMARAAGVVIAIGRSPVDARASGDADLLTRALENCFLNAFEHAPRGSTISVDVFAQGEPRVRVTAERVRAWTLFDGGDIAGQRPQSVFGRGLSLLCADAAARAGGARLELVRSRASALMDIVAPARV